ncbi:30S ribosomal protein S6 [Anaerosalibacter bizertensis]|uniref:30S ribosomal protein S6 n=1 Tax=Anaerosalibacter bizertensis TaxID=932217 RepID=UPI001C0EE5D1|nr:30S ribosomal protein S6 [Anaerosalibacter bizertensis]MBU5294327.1 30S ribosomal protein S6 [Anaerosalibacter bizertensis]
MKKYEAMLIFVPDMEDEKRNNLLNRFKEIIESDGTISNVDEWGSRKLAYEINDYTDGYYVVLNFESTPKAVDEINRIAKISDGIMRHMIIKEDE